MLRIVFSRLGEPSRRAVRSTSASTCRPACCPPCEGLGRSPTSTSTRSSTAEVVERGRDRPPRLRRRQLVRARVLRFRPLRPGQEPIRDFTARELDDFLYKPTTKLKISAINITYEGLVPKVQKHVPVRRTARRCSRTSGRSSTGPSRSRRAGVRRHPAEPGRSHSKIGGLNIADGVAMQISDLADWVADPRRAPVAPLVATLRQTLDSLRRDRPRLSVPRPAIRDAVRRRVAAGQDGPAPRVQPDRHHLRVRRADRRPAPARHPADEQACCTGCGTRATPSWWSSTSRRPSRSPTTWSTSGRVPALAGGADLLPGTVAGLRASGTLTGRHLDDRAQAEDRRSAPPTGFLQIRGARDTQPEGRRRRPPARGADRRDRRGGIGQELADPRFDAQKGRGGLGGPVADPRIAAQQPGHLHRSARSGSDRVRQGQRGEAGAVQRQLRGGLPNCKGSGWSTPTWR